MDGGGKKGRRVCIASHKFEYLRPKMGCEMLIDSFLIRQSSNIPPERACLQANRADTFTGMKPLKSFCVLL